MRTTLTIPDSVYRRAKKAAKSQGKTLSKLVSESLEVQLAKIETATRKKKSYKLKPIDMGKPRVDVADREALYRVMGE